MLLNGYSPMLWAFVLLYLNYMRASHAEPTLYKNDDFIIEALLPITSKGELLDVYAIATEVIKHTIDEINEKTDTDFLRNVKLGYEIIDDKLDQNFIMKQAIRIVSKYRPQSICREDEEFCTADENPGSLLNKRISAVIGPATSGSSVPSASLLGLYNIPQIGYSASSSVLSDKSRFKSFLRTIPSDTYQAQAMASFVKKFDWNYVYFIGNDDEYGRQGLASFKTAARHLKVCTADDVNIPFQRTEDAQKQIKEIIQKIKKQKLVRVVVIFMFNTQLAQVLQEAQRQGLENVTWILSDAIGPSIVNNNINNELLHGAFGVDFVHDKIPAVEKHLLNITVRKAEAENPWMLRLLEKTLDCTSKAKAGKRQCRKDERLSQDSLNLSNRWSSLISIINSIKAIAHGLDNLLKCNGRLANDLCANTTFPLSGKDLFTYIQNVSFTGPMGESVSFDESGDLATKKYTFRNVLLNRTKNTFQFKNVATWSSLKPDSPEFLKSRLGPNGYGLTWNNGELPSATCSQVCQPGQKQVGQSDCCWACHPCPKGEISNMTGATVCYECLLGYYANDGQTECLMTDINYVEPSDAFSIVIITISCIGLVVMVAVAALFFFVKDTPLIQDSNPILLGMLVFSVILGFVFSILQVSLYRTDPGCRFLGAFLPIVVLLVASTLLAKTKTCDSYLRKFASHYLKPAAQYATLIMIGALQLFQLLLMAVWFLTDSPIVHYMESSQALHIRECNSSWSAGRLIACGFPLLILFIATAFAFKERDDRKNHHEAKYISFCTISICILLIAFFPTYRFAVGMTTSVVIATTSLVGGLAIFGCVIVPKLYILILQPDQNVPEEERERSSHQTASSAHTGGSQHRHVYPELGEELRPPNDVEFMSSASSARESDAVKDVPVI